MTGMIANAVERLLLSLGENAINGAGEAQSLKEPLPNDGTGQLFGVRHSSSIFRRQSRQRSCFSRANMGAAGEASHSGVRGQTLN